MPRKFKIAPELQKTLEEEEPKKEEKPKRKYKIAETPEVKSKKEKVMAFLKKAIQKHKTKHLVKSAKNKLEAYKRLEDGTATDNDVAYYVRGWEDFDRVINYRLKKAKENNLSFLNTWKMIEFPVDYIDAEIGYGAGQERAFDLWQDLLKEFLEKAKTKQEKKLLEDMVAEYDKDHRSGNKGYKFTEDFTHLIEMFDPAHVEEKKKKNLERENQLRKRLGLDSVEEEETKRANYKKLKSEYYQKQKTKKEEMASKSGIPKGEKNALIVSKSELKSLIEKAGINYPNINSLDENKKYKIWLARTKFHLSTVKE